PLRVNRRPRARKTSPIPAKAQPMKGSAQTKFLRSIRNKMTDINETSAPAGQAADAPAAAHADGALGDTNSNKSRGSGRKLRTPFRRRPSDDAPAAEGAPVDAASPAAASPAPKARKSAARRRKPDAAADTSVKSDVAATAAHKPAGRGAPMSAESAQPAPQDSARGAKNRRRGRKPAAVEN